MAKIPSTQEHLSIEEIVDNLVVLKNGVVAQVLETSALNFDLLSPEEQDARIIAFANLLNGVNYPFQITIRTVRTDVSEYIRKLEDYKSRQVSKALVKQVEIYVQFIKNLTTKSEILDKRFFVTIPYQGSVLSDPSLIKRMFGSESKIANIQKIVQQAKIDLYPKRDNMIRLFRKMGITVTELDNNQLLMLFYEIYDPDKIGYQKLSLSVDEYTTGVVRPLRE